MDKDKDPFGICLEEDEDPKLPSLGHMAAGLAKTVSDVVTGALAGKDVMADPALRDERLAVCNACEFFIHDKERCSKCGCHMNAKVSFNEAKCPLNKWRK